MRETPTPWKFSVEGESGNEDVRIDREVRDDGGERGGGEGGAAPGRIASAPCLRTGPLSHLTQ
jgi:hypothetical protein